MPLKPFPLPISLGIDICRIPRVQSILCSHSSPVRSNSSPLTSDPAPIPSWTSTPSERLISKVLTPAEISENREKLQGALQWRALGRKRFQLWERGRALGITEQMIQGRRGSENRREIEGMSKGGRWGRLKSRQAQRGESAIPQSPRIGEGDMMLDRGQEVVVRIDDLDLMLGFIEEFEAVEADLKGAVRKSAEFLAGRFAAKEAAIKAHRLRRLTYQDISILRSPNSSDLKNMSSAPIAHVRPENGRWEDAQLVPINISHDGDYATAVCMSYELESSSSTPEPDSKPSESLERGRRKKVVPQALHRLDRPHSHAIFVRNVPAEYTDEAFKQIFGEKPVGGHICRDEQARSLGYGWIVYENAREALAACEQQVWLKTGRNALIVVWGGTRYIWEIVSQTVGHQMVTNQSQGYVNADGHNEDDYNPTWKSQGRKL